MPDDAEASDLGRTAPNGSDFRTMMLAELEGTSPDHIVPTTGQVPVLNSVEIDRVLADFRVWLEQLTDAPSIPPLVEPLNLQSVLAQFTALRHDVNLQTKAARSAIEQTGVAIRLLQQEDEPQEPEEDVEYLRPIVKMLLDLHDALSVAKRQIERAKSGASSLQAVVGEPPADPTPGFFGKLAVAKTTSDWRDYLAKIESHYEKLRDQFTGVADGYTMSLGRIERLFPQLRLRPIECAGLPFDAEQMEVIDTEAKPELPSGTVTEVLRAGYHWNNKLFRFAQVKVAK